MMQAGITCTLAAFYARRSHQCAVAKHVMTYRYINFEENSPGIRMSGGGGGVGVGEGMAKFLPNEKG